VLQDYFSNPVNTFVKKEQVDDLHFPAVTLCNVNKIHCSNLRDRILAGNGQGSAADSANETDVGVLCRLWVLSRCYDTLRVKANILGDVEAANTPTDICQAAKAAAAGTTYDPDDWTFAATIDHYLNEMPKEDRVAIAQRPDQLVKSCTYNNLPVANSPWCRELLAGSRMVMGPTAGVCYTFNYRPPNETIR